jgi:spore germination protein KC
MKKIITVIVFISLLIPAEGCSSREIEKLAVVNVQGFDKVTIDGHDQYQVTDRVLNPQSSKGPANPSQDQEILLTGTGKTLQETSRAATLRTPRQPFFGQMEAIVVGENLAKDGVEPVIQLLGRYPEARLRAYLMVAKGTAYDVLNSQPEMDETLSREIIDLADASNVKVGVTCSCDLNEFFQSILANDKAATAGVIVKTKSSTSDEDRVNLVGMAAFRKDKLVGYLNLEETIGYLLLWNKFKNFRTPIAITRSDKQKYTYLLENDKCKIVPEIEGDSVHFNITIKTTGNVDDVSGIDVTSDTVPDLENEISKRIDEIVQGTIDRAQGLNSDVVGFAYWLHRKYPDDWNLWKNKWDQMFPDATYDIAVTAKISNSGELNKNIQVNY